MFSLPTSLWVIGQKERTNTPHSCCSDLRVGRWPLRPLPVFVLPSTLLLARESCLPLWQLASSRIIDPTAKTDVPAGWIKYKGQEEAALWLVGELEAMLCKSLGFNTVTKAILALQAVSTTNALSIMAMTVSQLREAVTPRGQTSGVPGESLAPAGT